MEKLKLHHELKLNEFSDFLKTQYNNVSLHELITLRKLILVNNI